MTTDLWMLVIAGLWGATIPLFYAAGRFQVAGGIAWAFGNRDSTLVVAPWVDRTVRAHQNLTENIALFAILVLCAHVTGKANATTAMGAELFVVGRILHTFMYAAGLKYVRTGAFFLALFGEILILLQLLK